MVDDNDGSVRPDVVGNSQVFIRMELSGALPQLVFEVDQPAIEFLSEVRIYRWLSQSFEHKMEGLRRT